MLQDTTLIRQPILDRQMAIIGYELLLHPIQKDNKPNMDTLKAIHEHYDLPSLAGGARLFLPAEQVELSEDLIKLCPNPKNLVIEIDVNAARNPEQLRLLKVLRQAGMTLSLKDYQPTEAHGRVANACQMVKIDTKAFKPEQLQAMIKTLHDTSVKVIADAVENESEFELLRTVGFDYFQGFFFTNPIILHGKKLSANKLNLLQLLAKVNNDDTDFNELVDIIGHDVALTHKLLTAINKPSMNLPMQVTSIADGIRYMGMKRLKMWVSMILMAEVDEKPQALMETSLVRAKFCEVLAEHSGHKSEKDSFFLVGLFSTLGAYFNLPQSEVLDELPLADHLKEAMLEHEGSVGKALWIAKQFESSYTDLMGLNYEGMDIMGISNDYMTATRWGSDILRSN
jgi:EAL and modified HD-GYP domain-containing signal transduction protein